MFCIQMPCTIFEFAQPTCSRMSVFRMLFGCCSIQYTTKILSGSKARITVRA